MWDLVLSILGILVKRKKSNKEAVNWNVGPVARIHVDPCGLWKEMGTARQKVDSKPNLF